MNKTIIFLLSAAFLFLNLSGIFGGGIDNKNNFSAEYIRTLNRNASTDSADSAAYNPAGTVMLPGGNHISLSAQYIAKDYWHTVAGAKLESDEPSLVPSLSAVFNRNDWAAYLALNVPGGGGAVKYPFGSATTLGIARGMIAASGGLYNSIKSQDLFSESIYYGLAGGAAWKIDPNVSVSLGARYVKAEKETRASVGLSGAAPDLLARVDYDEEADGFSGILGINVKTGRKVNIGLRYETSTNLEFTTSVIRDDIGLKTPGSRYVRDLPAVFGFGLEYSVDPTFRIQTGVTFYLNNSVDWDWNPNKNGVNNGYDLGISLEHEFTPRLTGSIGYLYTDSGMDKDFMTFESPELNSNAFALGIRYFMNPENSLNCGISQVSYDTQTTTTGIVLGKKVYIIAVGLQSSF